MMRKLIFIAPFYCACGARPLYLLGYKVGGLFCATYIFLHDLLPSPHFFPYG
jgi:hypothetical protein